MSTRPTTMNAARALRTRQPDAQPSTVLVAMALASFGNYRTGTGIRPGLARVEEITGLHHETVSLAVKWLEDRGELRRDKEARRGSAAFFTWLGGMGSDEPTPLEPMGSDEPPMGSDDTHPIRQTSQQIGALAGAARSKGGADSQQEGARAIEGEVEAGECGWHSCSTVPSYEDDHGLKWCSEHGPKHRASFPEVVLHKI